MTVGAEGEAMAVGAEGKAIAVGAQGEVLLDDGLGYRLHHGLSDCMHDRLRDDWCSMHDRLRHRNRVHDLNVTITY